jgi:hypothetical protein
VLFCPAVPFAEIVTSNLQVISPLLDVLTVVNQLKKWSYFFGCGAV